VASKSLRKFIKRGQRELGSRFSIRWDFLRVKKASWGAKGESALGRRGKESILGQEGSSLINCNLSGGAGRELILSPIIQRGPYSKSQCNQGEGGKNFIGRNVALGSARKRGVESYQGKCRLLNLRGRSVIRPKGKAGLLHKRGGLSIVRGGWGRSTFRYEEESQHPTGEKKGKGFSQITEKRYQAAAGNKNCGSERRGCPKSSRGGGVFGGRMLFIKSPDKE